MLREVLRDEAGQGLAEYGLIIALVAIVTIGSIILIKNGISGIFKEAGDSATHPEAAK